MELLSFMTKFIIGKTQGVDTCKLGYTFVYCNDDLWIEILMDSQWSFCLLWLSAWVVIARTCDFLANFLHLSLLWFTMILCDWLMVSSILTWIFYWKSKCFRFSLMMDPMITIMIFLNWKKTPNRMICAKHYQEK